MRDELIGVTGVTGGIGGRVAGRLEARGARPRLLVRDPAKAPAGAEVAVAGYGDAEAMQAALAGVSTLLFVSASESADRVRQHLTAVDAAAAAGVSRVVYVSFYGASADATFTLARHHWITEERIRTSGMAFTFLRDNLYLDFLPFMVGADGVIRGPAGDGRFAGVTRDDIADCAVTALTDDVHNGQTYDLTGPDALTMAEAAEVLAAASGAPIRYERESLAEAYASRAHYGAPDWEVEGWVTSYAAIAAGELAGVTDHVQRLSGHPPVSLAEYLAADPDAVGRLRSLAE
jgi:uncharacterized protein YbjT (DUF2867 family)